LEHPYDIWAIFVDPRSIVLPDHVAVGVAHLFGNPIN
jgi:hypothetical protein